MTAKVNRHLQRAEVLRQQSRFLEASAEYESALLIINKDNISRSIALKCMAALADTKRMMGSFDHALELYEKAMAFAKELQGYSINASRAYADSSLGLALTYRAQGKWPQALTYIKSAEDYYKETGDNHGYAFSLWAHGGTLRIKGDIPGSIKLLKESKRLFTVIKDKNATAYCCCALGGANRMCGNYEQSLEYYKKANALFSHQKDKDTFGTAYSFCGIGNAYRMTGDFDKSQRHLKKALAIYKTIGDIVSSAYTHWSLAMLYTITGQTKAAKSSHDRALDLFNKTKDVRGQSYSYLGLCQLEFMAKNEKPAYKYLKKAFNITKQYRLYLEKCHTMHILEAFRGGYKKCYSALGIRPLKGNSIPINIP